MCVGGAVTYSYSLHNMGCLNSFGLMLEALKALGEPFVPGPQWKLENTVSVIKKEISSRSNRPRSSPPREDKQDNFPSEITSLFWVATINCHSGTSHTNPSIQEGSSGAASYSGNSSLCQFDSKPTIIGTDLECTLNKSLYTKCTLKNPDCILSKWLSLQ